MVQAPGSLGKFDVMVIHYNACESEGTVAVLAAYEEQRACSAIAWFNLSSVEFVSGVTATADLSEAFTGAFLLTSVLRTVDYRYIGPQGNPLSHALPY